MIKTNASAANMRKIRWVVPLVLIGAMIGHASAAGKLLVEHAWIRTAVPGATMLAGYVTLRNAGDAPLSVTAADSQDFGNVSLHQSVEENGIEHMRPLGRVDIAAGASVEFAPGGRHFMLMRPTHELKSGDKVKIHISTETGDGAVGEFSVRDDAP
jgi:copper(I)-binding protein